jgi:hypothetical protein
MKVTYEFDYEVGDDDHYQLKVFQKAPEMLQALIEIKDYMTILRKGWTIDDEEQITTKISEIIFEINTGEIL